MGDRQSRNTPLHVACEDGDIECVQTLLKQDDCDINCCNAERSTPLHLACQEGHAKIVRVLLSREECNLTCQDEDGDTPLHMACYTKDDHSEIVRLLLEKGCDPNCKNRAQRTPLHIAARKGNISLIHILLATKKCNLNHPDGKGNIPLHYACSSGSPDATKALLSCNLNAQNERGDTPLHVAFQGSGQEDICRLLIEQKDCDINCRNRQDNSPLHLACQEGHSEIVRILLSKGCVVNCQDEDGDTPLHMACYTKDDHSEIIRLLLEKGCDPNCKNRKQQTPLHIAASRGNINIIDALLATKECNLNIQDKSGNIPLHCACFSGSLDASKALLSCNLNAQNKIGDTPLHVACLGSVFANTPHSLLDFILENLEAKAQGFFRIAKLILEQPNCEPSCTNKDKITPLHIVCEGGQLDIFRLLFERSDCDINCRDRKGHCPLHLACHQGHSEIARLLLSNEDCDITCQDEDGDTPLHMACYSKSDSNIEIITMLVGKGCDPNCQNKKGITPLQVAISRQNRKMKVILQGKERTTLNKQNSQQSNLLHYACRTGQLSTIRNLLKIGNCDINCTDDDGDTPLHIACYGNKSNLAEILLDSPKCDPNIKNTNGIAPIHIASQGRCDIIKLLLDKKECQLNLKAESGRTALHAACFFGHIDVVRILVSEKERCDINCKDFEGATPLHYASAGRHFLLEHVQELRSSIPSDVYMKMAKVLLERDDCDPNCQLLNGSTPLHLACRAGNIETAEILLRRECCNPNLTDVNGNTALHIACDRKKSDLVEVLLNSPKCDPNIKNTKGEAPIHTASIKGQSDIVNLLLGKEECKLNLKAGNGRTALHAACFFCHTELVRLLLAEEDCDVNCKDDEGVTPLHLVCHEGHTEIGRLLLGRVDCNPNCQDEEGNTPLHMACKTEDDHSGIVELLLGKGCNPNCRNKMRRTPLHFVARKGNVNLINVLLAKGARILNLPDRDGDIPMHDACFRGSLDAAKALYSHPGCNINTPNREGDTPLHVLCKRSTDPILQLVLHSFRKQYYSLAKFIVESKDCNLNCQNNSGMTPLHLVCAEGELEIFKLLIRQRGCDINCRDRKGSSPLHLACHQGHSEIVQMLVSREECAVTCQDEDGDTPLHMACYTGDDHSEIVRILLEKGCDPNCKNNEGRTPLQIATTKGNANTLRALNYGNDHIPSGQHSNTLHMACKDGQSETVKRLLTRGDCNINCTDKDGNTPLHIACKRNNSDIVELLLNSPNCDLNVKNTVGIAPIHITSMEGQTDILTLLLKKEDCKLNLKAGNDRTALHAACFFCELEVLKLLLRREDCDVNCRDQDGATPLHYVSSGLSICSISNFLRRLKLNIPLDTSYIEMTWILLGRKDCNPNSQLLDGSTPLHLACNAGQVEIAGILLNNNDLDPNIPDKDGDTPLHIACDRNSSDLVEVLLDFPKCDPNIKNNMGMAPIHIASVKGQTDIVNSLLRKEECRLNLKAENGRTALHAACLYGHVNTVKKFLDREDCEINCRDKEGVTPLHFACFGTTLLLEHAQEIGFEITITPTTCYIEITKDILERKDCKPNCQLQGDGSTPLHLACKTGQVETAKLLLSKEGCDPNCTDKDGDTPLHIACESQQDRSSIITALLLASNPICDPNIQNKAGMTPLHIACIVGCIDHISLLLSNEDCKSTTQTRNGRTCLHLACLHGQLDVVKLLLGDTPLKVSSLVERVLTYLSPGKKTKCDLQVDSRGLDITDSCKTTALHFACRGGNIEIVRKLLEVKLWDINCKTETGDTPLHVACEEGHANIVSLLLENSKCKHNPKRETRIVEVNYQNIQRYVTRQATPVGIACEAKNTAVLKALLSCKHDESEVQQLGNTPHFLACQSGDLTVLKILPSETFNSNHIIGGTTVLHEASANGHLQVVEYLVSSKGSQCNIRNSDGNYPIHVACANGHKHIVQFLEDQGSPPLNENDQNLLHIACKHGQLEIAEFLMSRSDLLNTKDSDGNTSLHHACSEGHNDIVIQLINTQQCHLNVMNTHGEKPLHISCRKLQLDNICVLLGIAGCELVSLNAAGKTPLHEAMQAAIHVDKEAEETQYDALSIISTLVNDRRCHGQPAADQLGETPLMVAVSQPYSEHQCHLVETILHAKHSSECTLAHCNPVCDSKTGDTVLHGACKHGNLKLLEYLIAMEKYDLYCKNKEGDTLLHVACYHLRLNIVEYLLHKHSCNKQLNSQNEHNNTPVHNLFNTKEQNLIDRAAIAKLAFACPSLDSNIQNMDGNTAVHLVCQDHDLCSTENIALLINREGYNPNIQNERNRNTVLHMLCSDEQKHLSPRKRKEALQHLIEHPDLNPCIKNVNDNTPLHLMFQCDEQWWDSAVLKPFVEHVRFQPNIQNIAGDTALHVLCHRHCTSGSLKEQEDALCLLIKHTDLDLSIRNVYGKTVLHLMFQDTEWWDSDLLDRLVCHKQFDPNTQNANGDTIVHLLCHTEHVLSSLKDIQKRKRFFLQLIKLPNMKPFIRNELGNTPLHLMLQDKQWLDSDLLEPLVCHEHFDPNTQNGNGDTILHVLCHTKHMHSSLKDIQKRKQFFRQLIDLPKLDPYIRNKQDNTPLHLMLQDKEWWDSDLLEYLKCKKSIVPNIQNKSGETILHVLLSQSGKAVTGSKVKIQIARRATAGRMCQESQRKVTEILLECENLDPNIPGQNEDTPLHLVVQNFPEIGADFLEKHLDSYLDSKNICNHAGDTAIHILLRQLPALVERTTVDKVHSIIINFKSRFDHLLRNKNGETPLHIAAARGSSSIIQMLIQELQDDPVTTDQKGNTPLHLACQHGHLHAVKTLLSCGRVKLDTKNNAGKTPKKLAGTPEVQEYLSAYQDIVSQNPLEPFMKVFVVGNSGAGKTTLIKALFKDVPSVVRFIPSVFKRVSRPDPCTPGIIPHTFTSKTLGNILLYDFAGQDEYYTSHSAVLQHSISQSPPIFFLVVNMTETVAEITKVINKWLNFIRCAASKAETAQLPQLIIIGSHDDSLGSNDRIEKQKKILSAAKDPQSNCKYYMVLETMISLDCRVLSSPGVLELQDQLKKSKVATDHIFKPPDVGCNILYAHLTTKMAKPISITSLAKSLSLEDKLPSHPSLLSKLALQLNKTGHILLLKKNNEENLMKNNEESLIITDKFRRVLLHEINGRMPLLALDKPTLEKQAVTLSRRVGIVPLTELNQVFSEVLIDDSRIDVDLIMRLMIYLEFCHEISDSKSIKKFTGMEGSRPPPVGMCYFFPHVISKEKPENSWELTGPAKCGWYLQCTEGRLTSQFLHVLLQQLVSSFLSELHEDEKTECDVWKRGLQWKEGLQLTGNEVKTIVEVGKHNESVTVLVSCSTSIQCAKHCTAVTNMVLRVKEKTCDSVGVKESLISLKRVKCPVIEELTKPGGDLMSLDLIAHHSLKIRGCTALQRTDHLDVLAFDPYFGLDEDTIWELFNEVNSSRKVTEKFLKCLAGQITQCDLFEEFISDLLVGDEKLYDLKQQYSRQDSESSRCLTNLKHLRDKKCDTFQALRSQLNEFSILHRHLVSLPVSFSPCMYVYVCVCKCALYNLRQEQLC